MSQEAPESSDENAPNSGSMTNSGQSTAAQGQSRFTLARLSSAFEKLMGATSVGSQASRPQLKVVRDDGDPAPLRVTPQMIVEGMLFVGRDDGRPISARELAEPIGDVDAAGAEQLVAELNAAYDRDRAAYRIVGDAAGYRLQLTTKLASVCRRLEGEQRAVKLTPAAVETLAIVAYRQPVTGELVSKLRGKRSGEILAQLVRRDLLDSQTDPTDGNRARVFRTTERFNQVFGVSSPAELPTVEQLDDA